MNKNLRKRKTISCYEPDEPGFDEYVYCDICADTVYEYCSLHGPLLVIPDDQIAHKNFPSFVPRAALTIPNEFLHIAPSIIPGAGLGVFTTLTLPSGVRFGPYRGQMGKEINTAYCWQIYDGNNKRSHVVDAEDANKSNWMRYVNCSRHWREQNLVAYQYQGELYYRTIKVVPRFTELLIFYGSEYANSLNIDLRLYNSMEHPFSIGPTFQSEDTIKMEPHENSNKHTVSYIIDNFQYINEDIEEENQVKATYNRNDNKPPFTVQYDSDKQCFKLNFNEQPQNKNDKKFYCDQCDFKTNHRQNIKRHTLTLHPELVETFACNLCPYKTHMLYNLKRHSKVHKITSCKSLEYFSTTSQFVRKINSRNEKKKCNFCSYETSSKSGLRLHIQRHTKEFTFKCDLCPYIGYVKKDFSRHKKLKHNLIIKTN